MSRPFDVILHFCITLIVRQLDTKNLRFVVLVRWRYTWICIAPRREHTSKALRYGTRSQGISQFYLHTQRSSANGMNHRLGRQTISYKIQNSATSFILSMSDLR